MEVQLEKELLTEMDKFILKDNGKMDLDMVMETINHPPVNILFIKNGLMEN